MSMPKQRVLVLGAGGFVGRHVMAALATSDWATPVAAVRRSPIAGGSNVETVALWKQMGTLPISHP